MRQINLKIVKATELVNETKGSFYCEIIFKDMKFKTKPVKDKLIWDNNNFELGDYRGNDIIYIRLVSRRSSTLYGVCSIPLKDYKKCGIFEKEVNIFECIDENNDTFILKKEVIGVLFVEMIVFSPINFNRTQSEKKMGLNIFTRFRTQPESKRRGPKNGARSALNLVSHSNDFDKGDNDLKNGDSNKDNQTEQQQQQPTFGEIFEEKKDRERKRKKRVKKSEEEESSTLSQSISSNPLPSPTSERKKEKRKPEKKSSEEAHVEIVEREGRVKRKNAKVLRRSVSLAHNVEKSYYSQSAPVVRLKERKAKKKDPSKANEDNENNDNNNRKDDKKEAVSIADSNGDDNSKHNRNSITVVKLQPLGSSDSNLHTLKLFGVPLEEVMRRQKVTHPDLEVPHFFIVAAQIIRDSHTNGGNIKGIFRIRGKLTDVRDLRKKIDCGTVDYADESARNVHTLATLMKAFLRELPIPLLTFENYDKYIKCADESDIPQQMFLLKDIVDSIPLINYTLLKFVMQLMHELSLFPEETQMNAENLAKIISPNLIWKEVVSIDDMSQVDDALKGNQLANTMIVHYKEIFTR